MCVARWSVQHAGCSRRRRQLPYCHASKPWPTNETPHRFCGSGAASPHGGRDRDVLRPDRSGDCVSWTALGAANVSTLGNHAHGKHRPHLSLAVADEFPSEPVADALGVLPLPVPVSFQYVGQFPGGVLWLGPAPTPPCSPCMPGRSAVSTPPTSGLAAVPAGSLGSAYPLSMTARRDAVARAVPLCCDVLPLRPPLSRPRRRPHRDQFRPLPLRDATRIRGA